MKARKLIRMRRRLGWICVVTLVAVVATAGVRFAQHQSHGGSSITNPGAYATSQIAAGLRTAGR